MNNTLFSHLNNLDLAKVLEFIKEGIIILSRNQKLVYINQKAKEIYQQFDWEHCYPDKLPPPISELLNWLNKNYYTEDELFIMDYQLTREQSIRVRVHHLDSNYELADNSRECPWLLLFLEDRNATLQDELTIEQKKYNLTERELEVVSLLYQSFSYQEIANKLQVSLNTVKFHVKKINIKKQSYTQQD